MNTLLAEALDRTFLLMRDELIAEATDADLLGALTGTEVQLVADAVNLADHAAQAAFVTAAILMARSGHRVYLTAPDVELVGPQPPLKGERLITALKDLGCDLLPGAQFFHGPPPGAVDLQVLIGNTKPAGHARHRVSMNATAWAGSLDTIASAKPWTEPSWPMGALASAALAAGEAFKLAMQRLRAFARSPPYFDRFFALNASVRFELAPAATPTVADFGALDFVSGGAITHAALYCLLRILDLHGRARIIENTRSDSSNLNRYSLLRVSDLLELKPTTLARFGRNTFGIAAANMRLEASTAMTLLPFAPRVLLGVDHIPTRWFAQELAPGWLGIGATTHWNAMASIHEPGLACAQCLHPRDDQNDALIPTVAFVSLWSGLLLISYLVRSLGVSKATAADQHIFLTPLRAENPWWGKVQRRAACPLCGTKQAA